MTPRLLARPVHDIVIEDTWRDRIEAFAGRRRDLWVIGVVVAVIVVGALALWARSAPAQIAPPATLTAPSIASSPSAAVGVLIHVAGAVHDPGVYQLPAGARVADAVEAAGGPLRSANVDALNLAELLADGMKIEVPRRGQEAPPLSSSAPSPVQTVVDLNTADQIALETIPGIGPVTALAILQHRQEIGGFTSIDELLDVDGIGPATLESIRPYVSL